MPIDKNKNENKSAHSNPPPVSCQVLGAGFRADSRRYVRLPARVRGLGRSAKEMIDLHAKDGDDLTFLAMTASAITGVRERFEPEHFRIIRIDNWFGPKWHGFSGKGLGAVGIAKQRLTIPPFVPTRVEFEDLWVREGDSYRRLDDFSRLHKKISSEENLRRYLDKECPNSICIWYSGRTAINGRGSIMFYSIMAPDEATSWFVELSSEKGWRPSKTEGISPEEFTDMVSSETIKAELGGGLNGFQP